MSADLLNRWPAYLTATIGLFPLWTVWRHPRPLPLAWWGLGLAFFVSFLSDVGGMFGYGDLASQTYPLLQGGLFALVLAGPWVSLGVIGGLGAISASSLMVREAKGLDVALHVAAFGSTAFLAWRSPFLPPLRNVLMVGFAALAVAWWIFAPNRNMVTWGLFHEVRAFMALGFVYAVREAHAVRPDVV